MPAEDPPVDDRAALRQALLAHYDAQAAAWGLPLPAARAAMRLDRFKLSWLMAPVALLSLLAGSGRSSTMTLRDASDGWFLVDLLRFAAG